MPRAQEHVQGLHDMYQGLIDTLHNLEEQLKKVSPGFRLVARRALTLAPPKPIPRSTLALNPHAEAHARAAELEELIKREQMEIFALEQLSAEKRAEVRSSFVFFLAQGADNSALSGSSGSQSKGTARASQASQQARPSPRRSQPFRQILPPRIQTHDRSASLASPVCLLAVASSRPALEGFHAAKDSHAEFADG